MSRTLRRQLQRYLAALDRQLEQLDTWLTDVIRTEPALAQKVARYRDTTAPRFQIAA